MLLLLLLLKPIGVEGSTSTHRVTSSNRSLSSSPSTYLTIKNTPRSCLSAITLTYRTAEDVVAVVVIAAAAAAADVGVTLQNRLSDALFYRLH
jgi:hypothetical protein